MSTRPDHVGRPHASATAAATGDHPHDRPSDHDGDRTTKEALLGDAHTRAHANVSWGSIVAGVVTFIALTVVLGMASAAMGLDGASGTATGIWTVVALAVALAAAGYVAGALATRAGVLHGFLTWAASLLAVLLIAGWFGTSLLGAAGTALGSTATQVNLSPEQIQSMADRAQGEVTQQDIDAAQRQAQDAADTTASGMWWVFAGTLIGAAIATVTGAAGARSVIRRPETDRTIR